MNLELLKLKPFLINSVSNPDVEVEEPDRIMEAAAAVVEAMAVDESGRGWLCVPSYIGCD